MNLSQAEIRELSYKCPKCGLSRDFSKTTFVSEKTRHKQTFYLCGSILEIKQTGIEYKTNWNFKCKTITQ